MILPVPILFLIGAVFSEETRVTKRDRETVTLYMNETVHHLKDYLWTFGQHNPLIAITIVTNGEVTRVNGTTFGNRLHTHVETGSITISNLTISDSGVFLVQVFTETGILTQRFNLTVHDNSVISLNVLEGDNVTLDPGVQELQKDHNVKWTQGPDFVGKLIAQWKNYITFIEESFKGVLQLNPHTGSLTFIRVTKNYSDFYCVRMLLGDDPHPHILRPYLITVFEPVSVPHVSRAQANGNCYMNCCVENAPDVTLSWYRGEKKINQTSDPDISTNLTLPLEIQNQDEGIYSCVAANPVSKKAVTVNSAQWCPPHGTDPETLQWIIGVVGGVVVVLVVALIIYLCKRRDEEGAENCFNMRNMQEETPSQCTKVSEGSNETVEQQGLLTNS